MDHLYRALHLADSLNIPERQLAALRFLGQVHMAQGDVERAKPIAFRLLQLSKERDDERSIASAYNSIATVFAKSAQQDSALLYFQDALKINERIGNKFGAARVLANIGDVYKESADYPRAMTFFKQSFDLLEMIGHTESMAAVANQIASCYLQMGQVQSAIQWATKAYDLASAEDFPDEHKDAAEILSKAWEKAGNPAKALAYLKEYLELKTQLFNEENTRLLEQKALGYEYNIRETELKAEEARKQAVLTEQIKGQRRVRNLMILASVLLLLALFAVYNRFKLKQKAARELAEKNRQVEAARERAEKSEAFRKQFLANMSHEIRTPMNAIIGLSRLLKDHRLDAAALKYVNAIHHSADKLLVVLNDILDLSKIEAGKMTAVAEPFSLEEELEWLEESFELKANEKGLTLELAIPEDLPSWVAGDAGRLVQVLTNLLHNAIKFTEKGSVQLNITAEGNDKYHFEVADTGIGIAREKLDSIFESFQQAHSTDNRRYGGTGLGLSISVALVDLMGGQLQMASEPGKGSRFFFSLHLPASTAPSAAVTATRQAQVFEAKGIRILLAEDNDYNALVTEETLRKCLKGIEILRVTDGQKVLDVLQSQTFDLILMDVQMPQLDGYESTKALREQGFQLPVIALTASVIRSDTDKCLAAGMNDFVPKPFREEELLTVLQKFLALKPSPIAETTQRRSDNRIEQLFLELMPERLEALQAAIAAGDERAIRNLAHAIKPQVVEAGLEIPEEVFLSIQEGTDWMVAAILIKEKVEERLMEWRANV